MPRATHRLARGDFLKPLEVVSAGVPQALNADNFAVGQSRLDLARWLTRRQAPTTARAIVNRIWQEYFGNGLVKTSEDLGTQAEFPSHPELLDWLAVELMDNGWSLKHIHRLIVDSNVYRQSSLVSTEELAKDPENRLLARGPRFRVGGESVRDVFLAASGLLQPDIGGPGVYPPAPEFLFQPPASYGPKTWGLESGPNRYRRALYTFRFRSVPYPVLQNFDTPRGDTSCVRRNRSNTPLQALTTLNEELFMECCRALAVDVLQSAPPDDSGRIQQMVQRCIARRFSDSELQVVQAFLDQQRLRFKQADDLAGQLVANDPAKQLSLREGITRGELAAWTATARVLLNLDETITKE